MANAIGSAVLSFGGFPGHSDASVAVTGQSTISTTSKVEVFIMGDDTTGSHTAKDHRFVGSILSLTSGTPTTGVGFTIYGFSTERLQGDWAVRFVWSD